MKCLKEKTVINFFLKQGGTLTEDGYWISLPAKYQHIYLNLYRKESMGHKKQDPSLEIHGPRWKKMGNVHINSYWGWPRSVEELQRIWDEIRGTYAILCGISWKDKHEVEWDLKLRKKKKQDDYNWERKIKRWEKKGVQND